jgi:putative tricarboxylic transport membrane protein
MQFLDNKDRIGSLLVLAFSIAYLRYALVLPLDPTAGVESFTPRTLPIGLSVSAILFSLVQLSMSVGQGGGNRVSEAVRGFNWKPTLLLILVMGIYALTFDVLGFLIASFLFLLSGFLILGERRLLLSATVAASLVLLLWAILTQLFGLYLDAGDLYRLIAGPAT